VHLTNVQSVQLILCVYGGGNVSGINFFRSDRPESPTDLIFVIGSISLISLQVAAYHSQLPVPHFAEMLIALGTYKGIKIGSNFQKKAKLAEECAPVTPP